MNNKALNWVHRLLVINTLQPIMRIDSLIEGLVVSTFGVLISLFGAAIFTQLELVRSAQIAVLGFYAYSTVLVVHYLYYKWGKRKEWTILADKSRNYLPMLLGSILVWSLYLKVVDRALYLAILPGGLQFVLEGLPGLIALMLPLFAWEWLSKVTPVDEIVRWHFK
ncbi:MAG: hypothetical protein ABIG20_01285 [archaeon]